jgi:hypothetical protein
MAGDRLVWFAAGTGLELHFFPGESAPSSQRHFCLDIEDLDETRQRLSAAGYKPYDATEIPHRPRFFCRDPVGNLVEFTRIDEEPLPIDPALRALMEALKEVDRFPLAELPPANTFQARGPDELTR